MGRKSGAMICVPIFVNEGGDFGGFDFTATAPEDICVAYGEASLHEVAVDRGFKGEDAIAIRAGGHGHNVDIIKVRATFAPVAVGEAFVAADL